MEEGQEQKGSFFQSKILISSGAFFLSCLIGFLLASRSHVLSQNTQKKVLAVAVKSTAIPTLTCTPTPTFTPTPTLTPTPTATPTATPTPRPTADPTSDAIWQSLAQCESGQNWAENTSNGYFGGLQFSQSAWESVGGTGSPANASKDEQIQRGKMLQAARGWEPWGECGRELGLY